MRKLLAKVRQEKYLNLRLISWIFAILVIFSLTSSKVSGDVQGNYEIFFANVTTPDCERVEKSTVTISYKERGIHVQKLCWEYGDIYHDWHYDFGEDEWGYSLSVAWCDRQLDEWSQVIEPGEIVLWANEPDRDDQCDITVEATAQMFMDMIVVCPTCQYVGPMYSTADAGWKVREVWDRVGELCNCNPHDMPQFYAHSLHIYPRGPQDPNDPNYSNYLPSIRVQEFCDIVDDNVNCLKPIWVTEMGWLDCWPNVYSNFKFWLEDAYQDDRIEKIFVYTTFSNAPIGCKFSSLFDNDYYLATGNFKLTTFGQAYREAGIN